MTPEAELVERCAEAAYLAGRLLDGLSWQGLEPWTREQHRKRTIAVLRVLEQAEPTERMVAALGGDPDPYLDWQDMLRALREGCDA
jgi:hypothetical protein